MRVTPVLFHAWTYLTPAAARRASVQAPSPTALPRRAVHDSTTITPDPYTGNGRFAFINYKSGQHCLKFDVKNRVISPDFYLRYPQVTAAVGERMATAMLVGGTTKLVFILLQRMAGAEVFEMAVQRVDAERKTIRFLLRRQALAGIVLAETPPRHSRRCSRRWRELCLGPTLHPVASPAFRLSGHRYPREPRQCASGVSRDSCGAHWFGNHFRSPSSSRRVHRCYGRPHSGCGRYRVGEAAGH